MIKSINNEYGKLRSVVVSSIEYYNSNNIALNNETVKYYNEIGGLPDKNQMLKEQKDFWDKLKSFGVNVIVADQVSGAKGQAFTRDLGFVIGDKFFISNMKKENRRNAINGWKKIIDKLDNVFKVPDNIYLEGGDILVDNKTIYVGISERTNIEGVNYLKKVLGREYEIITLQLKPKFLHLDVVFTIINPNLALVYKDGLDNESYDKLNGFNKIEITIEEQFDLGTNVFVIDKDNIIINKDHDRIKEEIEKYKINVIPMDYSEIRKIGGAFRCTTCPIERG